MYSFMYLICAVWFGAVEGGHEGDLAAVRRVQQRAVQHGLSRLLVGQLIDEHVARVLRRICVERRHGDALFARLLQHRAATAFQIDRREFDRVRLLRQKVLQRFNLQTDVGMIGPRVKRTRRRVRSRQPSPPLAAASK